MPSGGSSRPGTARSTGSSVAEANTGMTGVDFVLFVLHTLLVGYCLTNIVLGDAAKESCKEVPLRLLLILIVVVIFVVHMLPAALTVTLRVTLWRAIVYTMLMAHLGFVFYCWYMVVEHSSCVKKAVHEWTAFILHTVVYSLLIPCSFNYYYGRYRAIDREKYRAKRRGNAARFAYERPGK